MWVVNGSLLLPVMDVPLSAETLTSAAQSVVSSFVGLMGSENCRHLYVTLVALRRPLESVVPRG